MASLFTRILRPVQRQGAERYLRLTLVAFAASVVLTRLFLSLTGYPQVGNGTLHIAHLLWGGLLLFVASLLPLMFANRWVYTAGGALSGVGVGLFIDEVGKFITRSNDYFYPAAAPIIYAFFLLTALIYLRVSRTSHVDPRTELYHIFDGMSEVLDHDLDPRERADLEARLKSVARQQDQPDYAHLAQVLLEFLSSDTASLVNPVPGPIVRVLDRSRALERRIFTRPRFRALLIGGLVALGLFSLIDLGLLSAPSLVPGANEARVNVERSAGEAPEPGLATATAAPGQPGAAVAGDTTAGPATSGSAGQAEQGAPPAGQSADPGARSFRATVALWLRAGLEALVGVLLLAAAYFLLVRRDTRAVSVGVFSLLLALTTVNLLVFYFDQFGAAVDALLQFALYRGLSRYRKLYLAGKPD